MLGKKGAGFWLLIYSISLFGVLSGLYLLSLDEANEFNTYQKLFGKLQEEIPLFYNNIDVEMEISRQEVRYHVFEVTNEFGENGGFAKENLCDKREGFVVIDFKICNPDLEANYLELFKREFKAVNINIVGNSVNGSLGDLNYKKELNEVKFDYKEDKKFNQDVFLDLKLLSELLGRIKDCKDRKQDLETCTGIKPEIREGYAFFTIENNKNGLMSLEDKAAVRKAVFKFAVKND